MVACISILQVCSRNSVNPNLATNNLTRIGKYQDTHKAYDIIEVKEKYELRHTVRPQRSKELTSALLSRSKRTISARPSLDAK